MNNNLFTTVDFHCSKLSNNSKLTYYDLIELDITEYRKSIYYCVDTFDLYNYVNPHYLIKHLIAEETSITNNYLLQALAYELFFKKLKEGSSFVKLILAEEYELEFDGLGSKSMYDQDQNDQFGTLIKDKVKSLIGNENSIAELEINLVLQYLQLALQFPDSNTDNLRINKIKNLKEIFSAHKSDLIYKCFIETKPTTACLKHFKKYVDGIKYKLIGMNRTEKIKILNSTLNDIKVIDKIISSNLTITNDLCKIGQLRYFSSPPVKTKSLMDTFNSNNAHEGKIDFDRNIYHMFFIQNVLNEIILTRHDIPSSELMEIGKKIINPNFKPNSNEEIYVSMLRKKISNNIENQYGIFYSKISKIIGELKKISTNSELIQRINSYQIDDRSKTINSLFLSANNLRYVDILSDNLKIVSNRTLLNNISHINAFDPIKNSFHSFPFLIFISIDEIAKAIPEFYQVFNLLSTYEGIEIKKIVSGIGIILQKTAQYNFLSNKYDSQLVDLFIIYFFSLFYLEDNKLLSSKIESSIEKLQEERQIREYTTSMLATNADRISFEFDKNDRIIRELSYLLLWIERKNYHTNNESIDQLIERNDGYIEFYNEDARFWHGRAMLKILKFEKEYNSKDEGEIIKLIESIFIDYDKALELYYILKTNFIKANSDIYNLICKSIAAILNSKIYKKLYACVNMQNSNYSILEIRKDLTELKHFCKQENINYNNNPPFCHTEFSLELLESFNLFENYSHYNNLNEFSAKLYYCRIRYDHYLNTIKNLNLSDYNEKAQIIQKSKLLEKFELIKTELRNNHIDKIINLILTQIDILIVKIKDNIL